MNKNELTINNTPAEFLLYKIANGESQKRNFNNKFLVFQTIFNFEGPSRISVEDPAELLEINKSIFRGGFLR